MTVHHHQPISQQSRMTHPPVPAAEVAAPGGRPTESRSIVELTVKRSGDRTWWAELDGLLAEGFKPVINGLDASVAESTPCDRCGHRRMDYRGFILEAIAQRSFALCDMCEYWFEF